MLETQEHGLTTVQAQVMDLVDAVRYAEARATPNTPSVTTSTSSGNKLEEVQKLLLKIQTEEITERQAGKDFPSQMQWLKHACEVISEAGTPEQQMELASGLAQMQISTLNPPYNVMEWPRVMNATQIESISSFRKGILMGFGHQDMLDEEPHNLDPLALSPLGVHWGCCGPIFVGCQRMATIGMNGYRISNAGCPLNSSCTKREVQAYRDNGLK